MLFLGAHPRVVCNAQVCEILYLSFVTVPPSPVETVSAGVHPVCNSEAEQQMRFRLPVAIGQARGL